MRRGALFRTIAVALMLSSTACGAVIGSRGSAEVAEANLRMGEGEPAPTIPLGPQTESSEPSLEATSSVPTTTVAIVEMTPEEQVAALQALAESLRLVPQPVAAEGRCRVIADVTNTVLDILRLAPDDASTVTALLRRFRGSVDGVRLQSVGQNAVDLGVVIAQTDQIISDLDPTTSFRAMGQRVIDYLDSTVRLLDRVLQQEMQGCDGISSMYNSEWIDLLVGAIGEKIAG